MINKLVYDKLWAVLEKKGMWGKPVDKRPYQIILANKIAENPNNNYILRLPASTGKTLIAYLGFYKSLQDGKIPADSKALVLVNRKNLANQWRDHGIECGVRAIEDSIYINDMDNYQWKFLREQAGKRDRKAREFYMDYLMNARWIITTPQLFINTQRDELGNFKYFEESGVLEKIKYMVIDEVNDFCSADYVNKGANRFDIAESISPSKINEPILNHFIRKHQPQVIGLTAVIDRDEKQLDLEHVLSAESITVDERALKGYTREPNTSLIAISSEPIEKIVGNIIGLRSNSIKEMKRGAASYFYFGVDAMDDASWFNLLKTILYNKNEKVKQYSWDALFTMQVTESLLPDIYAATTKRDLVEALEKSRKGLFEEYGYKILTETNPDNPRFILAMNNFSDMIEQVKNSDMEFTPKAQLLQELLMSKDVRKLDLPYAKLNFDSKLDFANARKNKAVIFTRRKNTARNLAHILAPLDLNVVHLTGDIDNLDLKSKVQEFKKGDIRVLIVTDKLMGKGTDLPEANIGIDFDYSSNPADAYQRRHRIRGGDFYCLAYLNTPELGKWERARNMVNETTETIVPVPGTSMQDFLVGSELENMKAKLAIFGEEDDE